MSETLKNTENSKNLTQTKWESLSAVKFNINAKSGEQKIVKEKSDEKKSSEHLSGLKKQIEEQVRKPANELSPAEASQEYLNILMELGQNFTSPEGKNSRVVNSNGDIISKNYNGDERFVNKLLEATNQKDYREPGGHKEDLRDDNKYLDRALNLHMVDKIIGAEISWQQSGEQYETAVRQLNKAEEALQKYAANEKEMSIFKKIFTFRKRNKEKKALRAAIDDARNLQNRAKDESARANQALAQGLNSAYSEDYHYGRHELSHEHRQEKDYADKVNEKYNKQFFSDDRMIKINRAIELRKQLTKNSKTNPNSL